MTPLRLVILGAPRVGKTAITVRYLTQRYIGEYSSKSDVLYRHRVNMDGVMTDVEILDTSKCSVKGCLYDHMRWGEAFVVVYSVSDEESFLEAGRLLEALAGVKLPSFYTSLLLGNKRDLDHVRQVCVDAGQELSLRHDSLFLEVSAAGSPTGIRLAFGSLLRQAKSLSLIRGLPPRRKLGVNSVSKVLGNFFGRNHEKKRPSLSI